MDLCYASRCYRSQKSLKEIDDDTTDQPQTCIYALVDRMIEYYKMQTCTVFDCNYGTFGDESENLTIPLVSFLMQPPWLIRNEPRLYHRYQRNYCTFYITNRKNNENRSVSRRMMSDDKIESLWTIRIEWKTKFHQLHWLCLHVCCSRARFFRCDQDETLATSMERIDSALHTTICIVLQFTY